MFYINKDTELTTELLHKMINKFHMETQPKLEKYHNYYDGVQKILNKRYEDSTKPCNKTVTNYCRCIADSYTGYIATPQHISYNSDEDITDIMDILKYNDYQEQDNALLLDMMIYGIACELMYIDNFGKTRFRLINPTTCFGVYDDSLTSDLLYFVRIYKANEWDESNTYKVDVYSDYNVKHYTMNGFNGLMTFDGEEFHFFSQVPANIAIMPDEKSIFDCVMSLQDTANELLSAEIDDFSAFVDSYLLLSGVDADEEDMVRMRKNRVLVLPEGATAAYLTKSSTDTQIENMLTRIQSNIFRVAQCPDFLSEAFVGGVSSGVAIQFKLTGMEVKAGKIEAIMKKALQRRIEIICGIASLKLGEEVFRDIEITFKRNIPVDNSTTINLINGLKGTVSDETLISQLDFIPDPAEELERVKAQKQENMSLYAFGIEEESEPDEE